MYACASFLVKNFSNFAFQRQNEFDGLKSKNKINSETLAYVELDATSVLFQKSNLDKSESLISIKYKVLALQN